MPPPSDPIDRLPPGLRKWAGRVRDAWHALEEFVEAQGYAAILGLLAAVKLRKVLRPAVPWILALTLVGLISPLTSTLGGKLSSTVATWSLVAILPLALVVALLIRASLEPLRAEKARKDSRRERERDVPGLDELLDEESEKRTALNAPLEHREDLPKLDELDLAHDELRGAMADIRKYYGVPDIGVVLLRDRKNKGFLPDIVKGEVDEVVREKLELGKVKRRKVDVALSKQPRPSSIAMS